MTDFVVRSTAPNKGILTGPVFNEPCDLGKGGVVSHAEKKEGDGATPTGRFVMRQVFYRPDRLDMPATSLPIRALSADDGWCDDTDSPHYNRWVRLPIGARHEKLWRDDGAYDLIIVLGYNDTPVVAGKGSAIFVHVKHDDGRPTAGCVALEKSALIRLLRQARTGDALVVSP